MQMRAKRAHRFPFIFFGLRFTFSLRAGCCVDRLRPPLLSEYLADLFTFAFGIVGDVLLLHRPKEFAFLTLRADVQKVASRHAETIADEIGDAQDEDDGVGQPGSHNTRYDGECRDRTIDRAVDEVA